MKNFTGTFVTAAAVAAVAGYAYFFEFKKGQEDEAKKQADALVLKLDKEKLSRLELVRNSGPLVLEKQNNEWRLVEPVRDSVDSNAVNSLVDSLTSERSNETVAEGDAINLGTYGLDRPVTRLIVKTNDNKSQEIKIGAIKSFDGQLYAQRDNDKAVLLVASTWDMYLSKAVKDLRDKRFVRREKTDFDLIRIQSQRGGRKQTLALAKKDGKWSWVEGGDETLPISNAQVDSYLSKVRELRAQDFVAEDSTGPDGKKYGVVGTTSLSIELGQAGEKPFFLTVSGLKPSAVSKEQAGEDGVSRFAVSSDSPAIVKVQKTSVDPLDVDATAFYDREYPFHITAADVAEVDIVTPSTTLKAKKQGETWQAAGLPAQKELDSSKLVDLIENVSHLQATHFLGKAPAKGVDPNRNKIALFNAKGEKLLQVNWGLLFSEKKPDSEETKHYFVKTSRSEQTLAVADQQINGLAFNELIKDKTQPEKAQPGKAQPATAPAEGHVPPNASQTSMSVPGSSSGTRTKVN